MFNRTKFAFLVVAVNIQAILPGEAERKLQMVSQQYLSNRVQKTVTEETEKPAAEENEVLEKSESAIKEILEEGIPEPEEDVSYIETDAGKPFLNTSPGKAVILDVDMSTDVDDVCAVRIATAMDTAGIISLKGVMYSVTGENNVQALRGLLLHDGKPEVKIGTCAIEEPDTSPYWDVLSSYSDSGGDIDDAVRQYRKILSDSYTPVDIVTTGYLTNLQYLLMSGPDDISSLSGVELVQKKVGQLYVVGGSYPQGFSNNLHFTEAAKESTDYVNRYWGKPIIFSPGETGGKLTCGEILQRTDTGRYDPVTNALYAFGAADGRTAWDPFGVWICGLGCSNETMVTLERCSFITNPQSGSSAFISNPDGEHYIVHLKSNDINYYNKKLDEWLIR